MICNICLDILHFCVKLFEFTNGTGIFFFCSGRYHHEIEPFGTELPCNRKTDSSACTCNDCGFLHFEIPPISSAISI